MAKHRHQPKLRILQRVGTPAAVEPLQEGLIAFQGGNLNLAIEIWRALPNPDQSLQTALAEAYFRRALLQRTDLERGRDLAQARKLAPHDPRILYQLGLAAHRHGQLEVAVGHYQAVLAADPNFPGAGLVLALARLEQSPATDLASLPGSTDVVRAGLAPVQQLLRYKQPPDGPTAVEHLWHGLGLIGVREGRALSILSDNRPLPAARATTIRRYYRGVAAAETGDLDGALKAWQQLSGEVASHPWLARNMAVAMLMEDGLRLVPAALVGTSEQAQALRRAIVEYPALAEVAVRRLDETARQAAQAGDWGAAAPLWQTARELVSQASGLGSPRALLHNLALAYEALERWAEAAEAWRTLARSRPRGTSAGASDYSEAQWKWVRTRIIECYKLADMPAEAVTIFRQAIKKDPQDLESRMQLVEALLANDQERAAIGELIRIREIDPDHVEATLKLAALHVARYEHAAAIALLQGLYARLPDRADVRQTLSGAIVDQAQMMQSAGSYLLAEKALEHGRTLLPDDWHFPLHLARVHVDAHQHAKARRDLTAAESLAGADPRAWTFIVDCWAVLGAYAEATAALERAKAALVPSAAFYSELGSIVIRHVRTLGITTTLSKNDSALVDLAVAIFDQGLALAPADSEAQSTVARTLMLTHPTLALHYAEESARLAPENANYMSILGVVQCLAGRVAEGQATLRKAGKQARKQRNAALARQCEELARLAAHPAQLREQLLLLTTMSELDMDFDDLDLDPADLGF